MGSNINWGLVGDGVMAFVVIALFLAPFFWWLYDTDRFTHYFTKYAEDHPYLQAILMIGLAFSNALDQHWWLAALFGATAVTWIVAIIRQRQRY